MILPDVAFALLANRTATAYQNGQPPYITYRERTHVSAPSLGRTQDINRSVKVRVADDTAVMQDLPNGGQRTGQAFPIVPYFDPISTFNFSYFANLKRVDITLTRGAVAYYAIPAPDPSVNVVVPYNSIWAARYAPDSKPDALHLLITPTPRNGPNFYPSEVVEDPQTHLFSHVEMRTVSGDEIIALDYAVIENHWVITHGAFTATEHSFGLTFQVIADVTYDQFTFPTSAPDPRLSASS
ncbi:MAG: hypothetical protein M3R35_06730 [Candidatus Eremiobacteraeota bacterium]|nr:hypothetical protein [Candidatus Eremiobacteraeota bacterium]